MTIMSQPPAGTEPPEPTVRARKPLDPEEFAARSFMEPGCLEAHLALELFAAQQAEARSYAEHLRKMAMFWEESGDDGDLYAILVADARRITVHQASTQLHAAYTAVTGFPHTLARLEAGDLPAHWFEQLLRRVRRLTPDQCRQVDDRVSAWDLANIPSDRFTRELGKLIAWFGAAAVRETPAQQRNVGLEVNSDHDGTARLAITGPVHEIVGLSHRLDAAARAVQNDQRHAVDEGRPAPFDIDGDVSRDGHHMTLAALRYAILTRTMLDTAGVEVPGSRFRLQVIVPAMTLLGECDAPGTIDGTIPLPAAMARHLAADEPTWYRILTDPATGAYLPLPPSRYSPTPTMQEHLRLLDPVCAVPGCTRNVCTVGESDHIEEYDHDNPEKGGQTSIENLHRLCWKHHTMKTRGLLDPVRGPDGSTTWNIGEIERLSTRQNCDLLTPEIAADLQHSWDVYEEMLAWDDARWRGLLQDAESPAPAPAPVPVPVPVPDPSSIPLADVVPVRVPYTDPATYPDPPF